MKEGPYQLIDKFNRHTDVTIQVTNQAKILERKVENLRINITVPADVLEWFVDVTDGDIVQVRDWWDYEGYGETSKIELTRSMTSDIDEFVTNLLENDVRLVPIPQSGTSKMISRLMKRDVRRPDQRHKLEWNIGGTWRQALPFC